MKEENYRKWDIIIKIVAPIVAVLGFFFGIWKFAHEQGIIQDRELAILAKEDALEFKRRVWERQLMVYMETANAVGKIATMAGRSDEITKSVEHFYTLYWGNMILLEDAEVREQMIRFHLEVQDYLEGISSVERLKVRAANVVDALRNSSHTSWIELDAWRQSDG